MTPSLSTIASALSAYVRPYSADCGHPDLIGRPDKPCIRLPWSEAIEAELIAMGGTQRKHEGRMHTTVDQGVLVYTIGPVTVEIGEELR